MKYYLFVFMTIFVCALGQEAVLELNTPYISIDESMDEQTLTHSWIGQQSYAQVEESCDMRGRSCDTFFYWKGRAFWPFDEDIKDGNLTLLKVIYVSDNDLHFIFIDESSKLVRAKFVFYRDYDFFYKNQ